MRVPIIIDGGSSIRIYTAAPLTLESREEEGYLYSLPSLNVVNFVQTAEIEEGGRPILRPDRGAKGPRTLGIWVDQNTERPPSLSLAGSPRPKSPLRLTVRGRELGEPRREAYPGYPAIEYVYEWPYKSAPDLPRAYRLEGPGGVIAEHRVSNAAFVFYDLGELSRTSFPWWIVALGAGVVLVTLLGRRDASTELREGDPIEPW
jgi:hypothetical protein